MRGVLVLLGFMPVLAALSPSTVGALMPLASLGLLATYVARGAIRLRWQAPISLLILAVVALGLISMSWALDPGLAQKKALKFGLVVLPPLWLALGLAQVENPQLRSRARRLWASAWRSLPCCLPCRLSATWFCGTRCLDGAPPPPATRRTCQRPSSPFSSEHYRPSLRPSAGGCG